jgi:hypothetical protein
MWHQIRKSNQKELMSKINIRSLHLKVCVGVSSTNVKHFCFRFFEGSGIVAPPPNYLGVAKSSI